MKFLFLAAIFIAVETSAQHSTVFLFSQTASESDRKALQSNAGLVFAEINKAHEKKLTNLNIPLTCATPGAIVNMNALWSSSRFYCNEAEVIERVLRLPDGWQVRNIPCVFDKKESNSEKFQDVVIEFTQDGRISDLYIALPSPMYTGKPEIEETRRRHIVRFLEKFYTAYYRRDMNFLNKVYGSGLEIGRNPMDMIRWVIDRNSFTIKFDEIEILQHETQRNIYGVTLQQKWKADSYSDEGWLFLMMDFRDEENPIIWARAWQPLTVPRSKVISGVKFPPR